MLRLAGCLLFASSLFCCAAEPEKPADKASAQAVAETPKVIAPAEDGSVTLHARDVTIHGKTVRYEPQPNKNTIGFWTKVDDWVSWEFEVQNVGAYHVDILQGCGKGSGGAKVDFIVTDAAGTEQKLEVEVQDTGHFQNFVSRAIGKVKLPRAGKYTFSVKPKTKPGAAVMDLRQVVLRYDEK
ncbi:MAG: hypothetical protein QM811_02150 [Pirellulales bacterium]